MQKEQKKNKKMSKTQKALIGGGAALTGVSLGIIGFAFGYKPPKVVHPNWRAFYRADGVAKMTFDKGWKANFQSLKQLAKYGEICPAYEVGGKFRTGHRPGWVRSLKDIAKAIKH